MWGFSDFFFSSGKGKCLSFIFNATRLSQCVCLGIIVRGCRLKGGGILSVEITHIGKIQTISFSPYQNLYIGGDFHNSIGYSLYYALYSPLEKDNALSQQPPSV